MITNAGLDLVAGLLGNPASNGTGAYAPANFIGVSADTATPLATDAILPGEIASGTLARTQASYSYTAGTGTFTLSNVFTADQTVTLAKIGVFNVSSGGSPAFESLLNATAAMVSGDQILITEVITV